MLSRFISRQSHLRLLTALVSSPCHLSNPRPHPLHTLHPPIRSPNINFFFEKSRCFSSDRVNNGDTGSNSKEQPSSTSDLWKISTEDDQNVDSVFGEDSGSLDGEVDFSAEETKAEDGSWLKDLNDGGDNDDDIFKGIDKDAGGDKIANENDWATAEGYKPWSLVDEEKEEDVFDISEPVLQNVGIDGDEVEDSKESETSEEDKQLEMEKQVLSAALKGPNRAFGDLIAASGITEAMLDSLIALKDLQDVEGLPPLSEIEDMRYEKNTKKITRAEIERQKQEEIAKSRVRKVDEKGRAYGTGRRKCSIARVWIQPGDGKFMVNDKHFDVYFPMLDQRAALLRPFSETQTLGLWDVNCTVKGGGVSGQVGAVRLGISRALQNWEPGLRPPLKEAGFLTRDSRVVERKKPGKAKARKSFQWVKR